MRHVQWSSAVNVAQSLGTVLGNMQQGIGPRIWQIPIEILIRICGTPDAHRIHNDQKNP
jgi:hypothetical protein